jgi:hypothetical protein
MPGWLFEWLNKSMPSVGVKKAGGQPTGEAPRTFAPPTPYGVQPGAVSQVLDLLPQHFVDRYTSWFNVACACKSEGEALWDTFNFWSIGGKGYDRENNRAIWDSIEPCVDIN